MTIEKFRAKVIELEQKLQQVERHDSTLTEEKEMLNSMQHCQTVMLLESLEQERQRYSQREQEFKALESSFNEMLQVNH